MLTQFKVATTPEEGQALVLLAALEMRSPSDQLRWVLREELLRRKLLEATDVALEGDGVSLETIPEGQV